MTLGIWDKVRHKESLRRAKLFYEQRLDFLIGPVELHGMMDHGEAMTIIDVRHPDDYARGHIPGAINLPEEEWSTYRGLRKDRPNIIYCYSMGCQLATRAAKYFVEHDFPTVELQGGIEEWQGNRLPVEHLETSTV